MIAGVAAALFLAAGAATVILIKKPPAEETADSIADSERNPDGDLYIGEEASLDSGEEADGDYRPLTHEDQDALVAETQERFRKSIAGDTVLRAEDLTPDKKIPAKPIDLPTEDLPIPDQESIPDTSPDQKPSPETDPDAPLGTPIGRANISYEEYIVLCDTDSLEEAETIAGRISGTLVSWEDFTAEIRISEPVDALLARLDQAGSNPGLYHKYIVLK